MLTSQGRAVPPGLADGTEDALEAHTLRAIGSAFSYCSLLLSLLSVCVVHFLTAAL